MNSCERKSDVLCFSLTLFIFIILLVYCTYACFILIHLHNLLPSGNCLTKTTSKDRYIMFLLNIRLHDLGIIKVFNRNVYVFWSPEKSFIAQKMVISLFLEFLWEVENICTVSVFFPIKHEFFLIYTLHHCNVPTIFLLYRHGGPPAPPRRTGAFMTIGLTCVKTVKRLKHPHISHRL